MQTFTITVQRRTDNVWPVVAEATAAGEFLPLRFESSILFDGVASRIGDGAPLVDAIRTHLNALERMPRAYGEALGGALFRGKVRDAFVAAQARSDGIRVLLFIEAPDLQSIRWKRVCGPINGRWGFLARDQRTPFSLYLPAATDRRFRPIGGPCLFRITGWMRSSSCSSLTSFGAMRPVYSCFASWRACCATAVR